MSEPALIMWALRDSSNSLGLKNSILVSSTVGITRPTAMNSTQKTTAYLPHTSACTEARPAVELVAVMNSSAATSSSSMHGKQKWNFLNTPTRLNSSGHLNTPASSTAAMPVDIADTRNRMGSSAVFHSGNVLHTPSRQPV